MSRLQTNHDAAGSSGLALESRATRFAIVAFVLTGVVTIFVFHGTHAPLAGEGSVGALAAWAAGGFAAVAFATSFTIEVRRGHAAWRARLPLVKRLIDVFGMATVYGGERLSENRLAVAGGADVSSSGFEGGSCVRLDA